jgi:hypothetical protein
VCEAGTYWIKIEPQAATGVPCNAKYLLQTSCGPGPCMRDYCSSPVSATIGVNFDSTFNSCCAQQNNAFIYSNACMGTQIPSGNDIQVFLFPFSQDTVDIIAESDDGDVQISVQSGFNCNSVIFGCYASADLNGPGLSETINDLILPSNFYYVQASLAGETACGNIRIRVLFGPEAPDAVEELVIYPVAPDIHLDWESISGAVQYKIYRSATTDVQVIPANLIGTTANTDFTDAGVLNTASEFYFYIVVAEN